MSAASCLLTEDQFRCSICLDVFTHPVSTPCGHNFCKTCITQHWDVSVQYQCPSCEKVFNTRPELQVNTFISEMAAQFRQSAQQEASSSSSEQQVAKPGDAACDICTGTKLKALKSCLVCLVSYCETHLEPHLTVSRLKTHQLIDPVENLEGRTHTTDEDEQMCVTNDVSEIQQLIQKRQLRIQEVKRSVELSKEDADREIADGVQVFAALKKSVKRSLAEFVNTIKEQQRETEKEAEGFIRELEEEISELRKRNREVEQLSRSEDRLHFIRELEKEICELKKRNREVGQRSRSENFFFFQNFLITTPKYWPEARVHPPSHVGTVRRAVIAVKEMLNEGLHHLISSELKRVRQYAVDVTLDPDTAHPNLVLSDDGKQVHDSGMKKNLPKNPERFDDCVSVLAKQGFSSGRFYFEVQVKGKTEWSLGVARKSINRKGIMMASPQRNHWTIWFRNDDDEYKAFAGSRRLSLKSPPEKVGVFVDYEEGLVSFYDVDEAALIYSFSCDFKNDNVYPFFLPGFKHGGKNSAPLIISTLNH